MPAAERREASLERQIGVLAVMPDLAENTFVRLPNMQVSIGRTRRTGRDTLQLTDVVIYQRPAVGVVRLIRADSGTYDNGRWFMPNAVGWDLAGDELTLYTENKPVAIEDRVALDDLMMPPQPEEQTASQLRASIANARLQHLPTQQLEIKYHVRYSVPASCIIFAFVAPALAIMFARSGFAGVLLSIFLVFLYYNVFIFTTEILGKNAHISPMVAAWAPNVLFAILGLIAIRRLE